MTYSSAVRVPDIMMKLPTLGTKLRHFGDVRGIDEFCEIPLVSSYLAIPVVGRSGSRLGALAFEYSAKNAFSDEQVVAVQALASQAAIALDNARLYQQA